MPNKTINDDNVKWRSKKKYPCKRNKGEHEWGEPTFTYEPSVRYIYNNGLLNSPEPPSKHPDDKFDYAQVSGLGEVRCVHCGKKNLFLLDNKI